MSESINEPLSAGIDGVKVGHWTNRVARTGCTVVRLPPNNVSSGEIRGGAPATREFALLDPVRTVESVDAVVMSGGSAFGLAAAEGVVEELEREGRGFQTAAGPVPIVVAMSIYDLAVGDPTVRPSPCEGRTAYLAAEPSFDIGPVGAGTGATVNKWSGSPEPGGFGACVEQVPADGVGTGGGVDGDNPGIGGEPVKVLALFTVNAVGRFSEGPTVDPGAPAAASPSAAENTTIGVVVTNARLDKLGCHKLAQAGHDGMARALLPAHTPFDGDAIVVVSTGQVEADEAPLRLTTQLAVERAILSAR